MRNHRLRIVLSTIAAIATVISASTTRVVDAADPCPHALRLDTGGAAADFDPGWTGIGHDNHTIEVSLTMASSCASNFRPTCGTCSLSGFLPNAGGDNLRCADQPWLRCKTTSDCTAQSAIGPCDFFLGPPSPLSGGGLSFCSTTEIQGTVSGTFGVEAGSLSASIPLLWRIYSGATIAQPCPRCVNDPSPNDGVAAGTCSGGARNGSPCDVNGTSRTFGRTSFDCPPLAGGLIGNLAVPSSGFAISTSGQTRTLSAASPNCRATGFTTDKCLCDTCNDAQASPCTSNSDCADPPGPIGPICGGRRCITGSNNGAGCSLSSECPGGACGVPGAATAPNACNDGVCTAGSICAGGPNHGTPCTSNSECPAGVCTSGVCLAGPLDFFCGPHTTFQGCTSNADCSLSSCQGGTNDSAVCTAASECPSGVCGAETCSISKFRPCFTDNGAVGGSVSATGLASPPPGSIAHPVLGGLFCMPPTTSPAVNSGGGFPSLGRLTLPTTLTLAQEIASGSFGLGGGSLTTDNEGPGGAANGASSADPIETTVTSPNAGVISITEQVANASPPGFSLLGQEVRITAPPASTVTPLLITFVIDSSRIVAPQTKDTIVVLKDGAVVNACTGTNDPCVQSRTLVFGSDVQIVIQSATASLWQLAVQPATVAGKKLLIKDDDIDTTKRKIVFVTKDPNVVAAQQGSVDDPTCGGENGGGGALRVYGVGASGQDVTFPLPCENWTVIGDPADHKGYKYKDKEQDQGPCKVVLVKNGKLAKAVCSGKNPASPINYDLTTGESGVGVTLTTGDTGSYCAAFVTPSEDDNKAFKAKDAPAPISCPVP